MKYIYKIVLLSLIFLGTITAQKNDVSTNSYWTQGKAEVNVYELSQNRYKENHPGHIVSVFVTEDFLTDKQVKNERYKNQNSTWTLKNIQLRKFTTGIYDYSIFSSTFTPIDRVKFPRTLKVTSSSQDWCGVIFLQLNYGDNKYKVEKRSYFEGEGDTTKEVKAAILEDELFNVLRMNPELLPKGNFKVIPSSVYTQLRHASSDAVDATGSLKAYTGKEFSGNNLMEYSVEISSQKRRLKIVFEKEGPYKIVGWLESYRSAFDGKLRTTKATLKKRKLLPYWGQNSLKDVTLRKELGLD